MKGGPQTLSNCHGAIREDAGIRNLKSMGLSSVVQPSPPQNRYYNHTASAESFWTHNNSLQRLYLLIKPGIADPSQPKTITTSLTESSKQAMTKPRGLRRQDWTRQDANAQQKRPRWAGICDQISWNKEVSQSWGSLRIQGIQQTCHIHTTSDS